MMNAPNIMGERLNVDDALVIFIDHQSGLFQLARHTSPEELRNGVFALADSARLFNLPVILTTSNEEGPNGPLIPGLRERLRGAEYIPRAGEVNAWDNPNFVRAVKQTGRRQLILSGITTDVCVALPALSALKDGYQVYVVSDASGSLNKESHGVGIMRTAIAGAQPMTWFSVVGELMQDWRRDPEGLAQLFAEYLIPYRDLIVSYQGRR